MIKGIQPVTERIIHRVWYKNQNSLNGRVYEWEFTPEELNEELKEQTPGEILTRKTRRKFHCEEAKWLGSETFTYITCPNCGHKVRVDRAHGNCTKCKMFFEQKGEMYYPTAKLNEYAEEIEKLLPENESFLNHIRWDDEDCNVNYEVYIERYKDKWAAVIWVIIEEYDLDNGELFHWYNEVYWIGSEMPRQWLGVAVTEVPHMERYIKFIDAVNT